MQSYFSMGDAPPNPLAARSLRSNPHHNFPVVMGIAPEIFRQRLLVEGFFTADIGEAEVRGYLLGIIKELDLRAYGEPIIFSPASGMGSEENAGYDAFIPLIDSGISLYVWTKAKFMSVVLYTCKGFDENKAVEFTKEYFRITGAVSTHSF